MDEQTNGFSDWKISALSKSKLINQFVKNVTIGPNKTMVEERTISPKSTVSETSSPPKEINYTGFTHLQKVIKEIECQRREKVQTSLNRRIASFLEHSKKQQTLKEQDWLKRQHVLLDRAEQEEIKILEALKENEKQTKEDHEKLEAYHRELADRRRQNAEKIKLNEQKRKLQAEIIEKIKKNQVEFREVYQEILTAVRNCENQTEIRNIPEDIRQNLQALPDNMNDVVQCCQNGKISEKEATKSREILDQIKNLKEIILKRIAAIEIEKANQKKEVTQATSEKASQSNQKSSEKLTEGNQANIKSQEVTNEGLDVSSIEKYISRSSFKYYLELQHFAQNYSSSFKTLLEDPTLKEFRFDCKKAVNIPVNAISAVSSQHLVDKFERLSSLLRGNKVVVGGTEVIASKHPEGIAFSTDLLARKFVLQGDLMISSNPDAAFCYATVIISLWNQFPDFGKLFLAHLHRECPYLVPLYPPRTVGQSDEEYYRSQGYRYIDGCVEKQDKFLKRMTGITRLYAAILISKPKRGQQRNPHNMTYAWHWFASFLNLEPRIDISATVIHIFLEIAGSTMQRVYGKQFRKLMNFVCNSYMPRLRKFDSGGPFTRLEVLLQAYQKTGQFEKPKGMLPDNFW